MALTHKPLTDTIGVEVQGLSLNDAPKADIRELYDLWLQYHVLVLRDTPMDEAQLIRFGTHFGNIEKARKRSPLADHEEIMVISNIRENGETQGALPDGELFWHFDRIHQKVPNKAGVLHALEIPSAGGETRFADMCAAYDAMPDSLRHRVEGLEALNTYQYGQTRAENKVLDDDSPKAVHPVIRTIPETGRNAIYVCRLMTDSIQGMDPEEGQALLEEVFDHSEQEQFVYEHKWAVGDTLIWDNRCVLHARNDFPADERRLLKRVTVGDSQPPVLAPQWGEKAAG